jgi:hypothetical protein
MTAERDDARRIRTRESNRDVEYSQSGRDPSLGMPCALVQTTVITAYPTMAQVFYACLPLTILGAEVEGSLGSITAGVSTFFALNIGSMVPPVGTNILATFVDNRWVFRYDG